MKDKYKQYILPIALILLFLILAVVSALFGYDIRNLKRTGVLRQTHMLRSRSLSAKPVLQASQIQSWMTFKYINYVFYLPESYLKNQLNITDQNYSNLTLARYATNHKLNQASFLDSVRKAVTASFSGVKQ